MSYVSTAKEAIGAKLMWVLLGLLFEFRFITWLRPGLLGLCMGLIYERTNKSQQLVENKISFLNCIPPFIFFKVYKTKTNLKYLSNVR